MSVGQVSVSLCHQWNVDMVYLNCRASLQCVQPEHCEVTRRTPAHRKNIQLSTTSAVCFNEPFVGCKAFLPSPDIRILSSKVGFEAYASRPPLSKKGGYFWGNHNLDIIIIIMH